MDSPKHADPTVWETIFASPVVIVAARVVVLSAAVVLLFGGLYVAASILYRMRHGQWLQRAGPFEAHLADEVNEEIEKTNALLALYASALGENSALTAQVKDGDRRLRDLVGRMQTEHSKPDSAET